MSFSEKTWVTGDTITADLLNRLEQALASHDTNITSVLSNLGDLTQLKTSSKGNLVNALNEVKGIIPVGGSGGSGSLVYNTLTDLQNAYPNGTTQPAWVISDNAWYYWNASTTTVTPNDVTGLVASNVASTTLTLNWTASSGATSYDVYQGSTLLGNVTSTTYNVTGLSASTSYAFKVIAKNSAGSAPGTGSGATASVTTSTPPQTAPSDVTGLATSNVSSTSLTLTWTASSTASSYDVYNGATLLGNATSTTYNVTGLTASTSYTFKVVAKNSAGSSTGVTVNATTLATAPNPVTNLAVATASITSNSIPVTWTAPSGGSAVANYEVAYSSNNGSTYTVASNVVNSSSTSYTFSGLTASTAYVVRVVAIDASGNRSSAVTTTGTTLASADTTPPTVTASPSAGTYNYNPNVNLTGTDDSGGAVKIYYTTNGTTPTQGSTLYAGPIAISATTTLKFIGVDPSGNQSSVQTVLYTIDTTPPVITVSPSSGATFTSATQSITLTSNETATIYYTTDGTTPSTNSTVYTGPITISTTTTLKYFGVDSAGNASTVQTATYSKINTVVSDTFNRANGAVGTAETGQTWVDKQNSSNVWNVVNNQLQFATKVSDGRLCVDSGVSDNFSVEALMMGPITSTSSRLIIRDSGTSYILVQNHSVMAQNSGWVTISAATGAFPTFNAGDRITVQVSGNTYTILQNGVQQATFTYALPSNNVTFHGIGSGDQGTNFDNFKILQTL